jgi:DNA ligase (NAD+)
MIAKLEGFKERTAEMFVPYIPEFVKFIKSINLSDKLTIDSNKENVDKSHPLYGKKIILTGVRDKELQSKIEEVGGKLSSSVSKNTFIVIVKSLDDDTGKADKAREIGIPLITIQNFKKKYFI